MNVRVYSKPNCPSCVKAKKLLEMNDIVFEEVDAVANRESLIESVQAITGSPPKTVPQVFINDLYIGGAEDLETYLNDHVVGYVEAEDHHRVYYTIEKKAITEAHDLNVDIEAEVRGGILQEFDSPDPSV